MATESNTTFKIRLMIIPLVMSVAFIIEVINTIVTWDNLMNGQSGSLATRMLLILVTGFGLMISTAIDND